MLEIAIEADGEWDSSIGWAALADRAVRSAIAASCYNRLLDSPFLLLIVGFVVMFVFYTAWGVVEVTAVAITAHAHVVARGVT